VLGHATYDGLENNDGQNPVKVIAADIGNFAWHGLALGQALGVDTNISRAYDAATRPGNTATDGLAVISGGAAGQFVPAGGGDVNAVLNNGLKVGNATVVPDALNPTHEAADTRVQSTGTTASGAPSKAKDYVKSSVASFVNRIPFASQNLPRKVGSAAADLFDRTTKGDRDTQASKDTRFQAKTEADTAKDFKSRDIPNFKDKGFDDAVEARVENGEFDKAIEATQAKLDDQKKNKDIPGKKNEELETKIKQYQVLKDGKFDPKIRDLYSSTTVEEWRNMGDPEEDTYDPETYQKLFDYDNALAGKGISGSTLSKDKNKFTAKEKKSGKGSGDSTIKSNTLGNAPDLAKISLGDLAPQKAGSIKMPTIQQIKPGELIKKRTISVSR
jgi:hypothetical protein